MAEQEGKTIHSVAKAIRLLDLLTAAGQPASLTELYQKTGWPKSTIHGLLSTDRKSTRLNSSHITRSRMPSSA